MRILTFGHSPDVDDAYMFYGIANGLVETSGYQIRHLLEEIEQLNRRALAAELEITAISAHTYAHVASSYRILSCGASVARSYGPVVVSVDVRRIDDLSGRRIAVPGELTTAHLLARLYLPPFLPVFLPFREVEESLRRGEVEAAILIHEGQIETVDRGLQVIVDLGKRFCDETSTVLPLGLDVVRRDLGPEVASVAHRALRDSIVCAHANHDDALSYALTFNPSLELATADRFVRMYVNQDTLDMPDEALAGLERLYEMAAKAGLIPGCPPLDLVT